MRKGRGRIIGNVTLPRDYWPGVGGSGGSGCPVSKSTGSDGRSGSAGGVGPMSSNEAIADSAGKGDD